MYSGHTNHDISFLFHYFSRNSNIMMLFHWNGKGYACFVIKEVNERNSFQSALNMACTTITNSIICTHEMCVCVCVYNSFNNWKNRIIQGQDQKSFFSRHTLIRNYIDRHETNEQKKNKIDMSIFNYWKISSIERKKTKQVCQLFVARSSSEFSPFGTNLFH